MSSIYPYKLTFAHEAPGREASLKVTVEGKKFRIAPPSKKPLYTKKNGKMEHSVWTGEFDGKRRVFVSLPEVLNKGDFTLTNVREACIIDLDRNNRVQQITPAVKISCQLDKTHTALQRRLSIMQRLAGSRYYPKNEAMFEYNGRYGRTVAIFQERASSNLTQYLNDPRSPKISHQQKLHLCKKLVLGLIKLHNKGILHKDLKPENILLYKKEGRLSAKITDFDIACKLNDRQSRQALSGTMLWAPPEFIRPYVRNWMAGTRELSPNRFTPAFDVWSLGLIFNCLFHPGVAEIVREAEKMGEALIDIEALRNKVKKHARQPQKSGLIEWLKSFFCSKNEPNPLKELLRSIRQYRIYKENWKSAIGKLPPRPKTLRTIDEIIVSMVQEKPENRARLQQVLEALEKLEKKRR